MIWASYDFEVSMRKAGHKLIAAEAEAAEAPAETAGEDVMQQADTVSTEEVAKDETKEAKQADPEQDANAGDDEAVAEKVESEAGEAKAEPKA